MKKIKFKDNIVLVVGLSSGNIVLVDFKFSSDDNVETTIIGNLKRSHDFGVNSLDAMTFKRSVEVIKTPTDQNQILIASGGDD